MPRINNPVTIGVPSGTPPEPPTVAPDDQTHPDRNQRQPITIMDIGIDSLMAQFLLQERGRSAGIAADQHGGGHLAIRSNSTDPAGSRYARKIWRLDKASEPAPKSKTLCTMLPRTETSPGTLRIALRSSSIAVA